MRPQTPPTASRTKTRLQCDMTSGYTVKPGARYYEWCPFCGYPVEDSDDHELLVDVGT